MYPSESQLTTVDAVAEWCKISKRTSEIDTAIETLIERVSSFLSLQISPNGLWLATDFTDVFDGNGKQVLSLNRVPINHIDSVTITGQSIPPTNGFPVYGYKHTEEFVILVGHVFSHGRMNVVIEYNAGVSPTSKHFKVMEQACLEAVNMKWQRREHPHQIVGKTNQFITEKFSVEDFPAEVWTSIELIRNLLTPIYA